MEYTATYLTVGKGPKTLVFSTNKTDKKEIDEEAWRKAASKEGVNPEKIQLLNCEPS